MLRIQRPQDEPEVLRDRGRRKRIGNSVRYAPSPDAYDRGARRFDFDSGVYGHEQVKSALIAMQHGKCAFCESKVRHIAYGDVEHFRPKAGFRQDPSDPLGRPGYYWLAYAWENLLFSYQLCNQRYKRNLFPLRDPSARARNHRDSVGAESPVFVNPAEEDPAQFVGFHAEVLFGLDVEGRGRETIDALNLNRIELVERRRDRLMMLKSLFDFIEYAETHPEDATLQAIADSGRRQIERSSGDSEEYAAMVRAAFSGGFEHVA